MLHPSNKKRSKKSEDQAAKEIGGRRMPNSGAISGFKGDVKSKEYLLEDKFTDYSSYSLSLSVLKKMEHEALQNMRKPLLRLTIQGEVFYVLPRRTFLNLLNQ
jgi:hypothetical protein